jgi:putative tRNA adenosine deaminase-associated protein
VSYFTAVIARSGAQWRAVDVDVEDAESLDELAESLRGVSRGGPVLAVVEREDDWFALVRVDGDEDPRTFVSDLPASERSQYAALLAPVGDVELAEYAHLRTRPAPAGVPALDDDTDIAEVDPTEADDATDDSTGDASDEGDDAPSAAPAPARSRQLDLGPAVQRFADAEASAVTAEPLPWAGDPGLLADVGVDADELIELVDEGEGDPGSVIASVGERCGFDELLDALR